MGEKLTGRLVAGMKAWHGALINYSSDQDAPEEHATELGAGFFKPGGEPNIPSQVHDVVIVNQVRGVAMSRGVVMSRGVGCHVVWDVTWCGMSRGVGCHVVWDVTWCGMSRGVSTSRGVVQCCDDLEGGCVKSQLFPSFSKSTVIENVINQSNTNSLSKSNYKF